MDAPLYNALVSRAGSGTLRMHMPGHKGKCAPPELAGAAGIDFTELEGTGNLYTGEGPIAEAEALCAKTWGADGCCFLTGGSTQGVHAALALCAKNGDAVLLDRNSHRSFFTGMALLGLEPVYLTAPSGGSVAAALDARPDIRTVCVTSPTYYGAALDIEGIAAACRARGAALFVDEAHGAHFPFVGMGGCAVSRGADISVASAHKTLPALGSAAMLFLSRGTAREDARAMTAMFGTSSPSYAIMASIDWARAYMTEGGGAAEYMRAARAVSDIRKDINSRGVFRALCGADRAAFDPTRLTVDMGTLGGKRAAALLGEKYGVVCEMADRDRAVFIVTCADSDGDLERLDSALRALEALAPSSGAQRAFPPVPAPVRVMSVRDAAFSPRRSVALSDAEGCAAAECIAPYPPGVPVLAPGERITAGLLGYLSGTGFDMDGRIAVVKEEK